MTPEHTGRKIAILCRHVDFAATGTRDDQEMSELAKRCGYAIIDNVIIDPRREGPWVTVLNAIGRAITNAECDRIAVAVFVPDVFHVDGIDYYIKKRAVLINVAGEKALERTGLQAVLGAVAKIGAA
ncbi:hypothetical protein [Nocardia wallacei]|uniref:hypothetical protein n=1 Tax=Nocardia wallacei TaxID=480035 RepID=UPI0024576DF3|nr:hypothetical protein [Nocardia wallacei]